MAWVRHYIQTSSGLTEVAYRWVYDLSDIFHPKPSLPRILREGWHECLEILRKFNHGVLRWACRGIVRIDEPAEKVPEEEVL